MLAALPPGAGSLASGVLRRYAEPWRRYHDRRHLAEVAGWFGVISEGPGWGRPDDVALAVLFHDAVYEPGRSDNEERSAALAAAEIEARMPACRASIPRVQELIRLTAQHGGDEQPSVADDEDAAHFLDADMAILGAPADRFDEYERQVRAEFAPVVPPELYVVGRGAFLRGLLKAEQIFLTPLFADRLAPAARANLERALAALEG